MKTKIVKEIMEWVKSLAIAGILAFVIHTFLFALVIVDGSSMEPTLYNSERLILNKISYNFNEPQRGDIIVFHANKSDDYIKRVIGLPGETVEVKDDELYINGELIPEPYLNSEKERFHSIGSVLTKDFGPIKVQEGHLFVMGDNRNNSTDSRMIGTISIDEAIGRTNIIIWPLNKIGKVE